MTDERFWSASPLSDSEADALRRRFARSLPSISIPEDEQAAGAGAGDRRAAAWWVSGAANRLCTVSEIQTLFINRMATGRLMLVLESDTGLTLHLVTNRRRVMVMLTEPGDSAGHATDAHAEGTSDGYVLDNGQEDEYPDRDTVTIPDALTLIGHILSNGTPPQDGWQVDVPA